MFFTKEQIQEIRTRLLQEGSKDTQFELVKLPFEGTESLPIVQEGENKIVPLSSFIESIYDSVNAYQKNDFFNVSRYLQKKNDFPEVVRLTLSEAIAATPSELKQGGQVITFATEYDQWEIWQYIGVASNNWEDIEYWKRQYKGSAGVVFTITPSHKYITKDETINVKVETVDKEEASFIELYINNSLKERVDNQSSLEFTESVSNLRTVNVLIKAKQYAEFFEEERALGIEFPILYGYGTSSAYSLEELVEYMDSSYTSTTEINTNIMVEGDEEEDYYIYILKPSSGYCDITNIYIDGVEKTAQYIGSASSEIYGSLEMYRIDSVCESGESYDLSFGYIIQ